VNYREKFIKSDRWGLNFAVLCIGVSFGHCDIWKYSSDIRPCISWQRNKASSLLSCLQLNVLVAICMDQLCTHRMACCKTWY